MSTLLYTSTFIAALGSGLVAGIFYAFSTFIMKALGKLPPKKGIAAMQPINVVIINPWFIPLFIGTALLCDFITVLALMQRVPSSMIWLLAGSMLYFVGCFVVTMIFNVPRNNTLDAVNAASAKGARVWADHLKSWTAWNHVRTVASLGAMVAFIVALTKLREIVSYSSGCYTSCRTNFLIRHLLACTALVLTACGDSKVPSGKTAAEGESTSANGDVTFVEEAKAMTQKAIDSVEKLEWETRKNKLTPADLSEAKKVLDGIDLSAAKAKYDELAAALARKDYAQAEFYARQFDELMSSDVAGTTIGFLKLKAEKGTDAAVTAVKEYLNTPGLGESSRKFGENMLSHFQSVEQEQVEAILSAVVYYAVDSKVQLQGPHGGNMAAIAAVAVVTKGFDAYDFHSKEGMEISDAIFKSMGTNEEEATKAWNEIVAASKKGVGTLKDGLASEGASEKAKHGFNALLESGKKFLDDEIKRLEEEGSDAEKSGAAGGTSDKQP